MAFRPEGSDFYLPTMPPFPIWFPDMEQCLSPTQADDGPRDYAVSSNVSDPSEVKAWLDQAEVSFDLNQWIEADATSGTGSFAMSNPFSDAYVVPTEQPAIADYQPDIGMINLDSFENEFWFDYPTNLLVPDSPPILGDGNVHPLLYPVSQEQQLIDLDLGNPFVDSVPEFDSIPPWRGQGLVEPFELHQPTPTRPTPHILSQDFSLPELNFSSNEVVDSEATETDYFGDIDMSSTSTYDYQPLSEDEINDGYAAWKAMKEGGGLDRWKRLSKLPRLKIPSQPNIEWSTRPPPPPTRQAPPRQARPRRRKSPPPCRRSRPVPHVMSSIPVPHTHYDIVARAHPWKTGHIYPTARLGHTVSWYQATDPKTQAVIGYIPRHEIEVPSSFAPVAHPPAAIPIQQDGRLLRTRREVLPPPIISVRRPANSMESPPKRILVDGKVFKIRETAGSPPSYRR